MPTVSSPGRNNGITDRYGLEEIYYEEGLVVKVKNREISDGNMLGF